MRRAARTLLVTAVLLASLAGCGWVGASGASPVKPDAFVLRGRVAVPVPAADQRPAGDTCAATVPGIVAGAPVRVIDPAGKLLATGSLGDGVIARGAGEASCDFPFQIAGVPGGVASYDVAVADQPPQRFPAKELRENADAIIHLTG